VLIAGPNLTIDRTATLPELRPGEVLRFERIVVTPGGKGLNVARAARALGVEALLVGFVPGETGRAGAGMIGREGVALRAVPCGGELRSTAIVMERGGRTTVLNEPGPRISADEWAAYEAAIADEIAGHGVLVCSGSVPPGSPVDAYARLTAVAAGAGRRCVVDAAGTTLARALAAHPDVVCPNVIEAEEALGALTAAPGARSTTSPDENDVAPGASPAMPSSNEDVAPGAWSAPPSDDAGGAESTSSDDAPGARSTSSDDTGARPGSSDDDAAGARSRSSDDAAPGARSTSSDDAAPGARSTSSDDAAPGTRSTMPSSDGDADAAGRTTTPSSKRNSAPRVQPVVSSSDVRERAVAAAAALVARGALGAVVTADAAGAALASSDGEQAWLPAPRIAEVRNPIGAGDVLASALAGALERGEPLLEAARRGVAAAAASVEWPTAGELDAARAAELLAALRPG